MGEKNILTRPALLFVSCSALVTPLYTTTFTFFEAKWGHRHRPSPFPHPELRLLCNISTYAMMGLNSLSVPPVHNVLDGGPRYI